MLDIRFATLTEVPAIQRIGIDADQRYLATAHPECADGTTIPSAAAERAITTKRLLVACEGERVVGWALMGTIGDELCIGQVSVATNYGRRGAGAQLLKRVIDLARERGAESIVLNTQRDVPWCMPWYAKHGFAEVAQADVSAALRAVEHEQTASGLDWSTRVHMRLHIARR
jgi:predicted N-acetyltransferase YhbS